MTDTKITAQQVNLAINALDTRSAKYAGKRVDARLSIRQALKERDATIAGQSDEIECFLRTIDKQDERIKELKRQLREFEAHFDSGQDATAET